MTLHEDLRARYASLEPTLEPLPEATPVLETLLSHRTVRHFRPDPLPAGMLEWLLACAQSAPTKSDLQGMSVIAIDDAELRRAIGDLVPTQPWVVAAPVFLVWCPDMRRNQEVCRLRGKQHDSNTLDTFLNVSIDTALCMQNFTVAAESLGLGVCDISVLRNEAATISRLLNLPAGVYPLAGMCVGYPAAGSSPSPRLPQPAVLHRNRYETEALPARLRAYDAARRVARPYPATAQLHRTIYGEADDYGWLEHTARRMEQRERADFRQFLEAQGFALE